MGSHARFIFVSLIILPVRISSILFVRFTAGFVKIQQIHNSFSVFPLNILDVFDVSYNATFYEATFFKQIKPYSAARLQTQPSPREWH